MKIVFLYSEVVGYVISLFRNIITIKEDVSLDVVFFDKNKTSGYKLFDIEGATFHARSSFDVKGLESFLDDRQPDILYLSGWMDKDYITAAKEHKKKYPNVKVVAGIDDQWMGSLRQHLGVVYYQLFYRKLFDYLWVSGKPQYHFAQRMGYDNYHIIRNLYSADTSLFNKKANPCKRFVYLGRFLRTKGIINLVESYERLPESIKKEWPLVLIGDGPLMQEVKEKGSDHIIIKGFLQPKELQIELSKGGVCCMPSTLEQWGVSIHEFALMGYPLILSSVCGAATEFLIKGYNGYLFRLEEKDGLCDAFKKITLLDEDELELFSQRSYLLGQRINPELSVYSLLSILE